MASHSSPPKLFWVVAVILIVVAATPTLVVLFNAGLPFIVVLTVAVIAVRLVWFHTRRW
jgi:hypothetical protein